MNLLYIMSQPIVKDYPLFKTSSLPTYNRTGHREGISSEQRDLKIINLEKFISDNIVITDDEDGVNEAEINTQDEHGKETNFFYFIGRLNPPHNGHLKALETLVKMANNQGSTPLILLGSGPKGERTMDNPITFDLKRRFIDRVLREKLPESTYTIREMTNPAGNIASYVREGLGENSNIDKITITHIAGGKDEDTTKLSFALKTAEKTAKGIVPEADVETRVEAIEAETTDSGKAMSATKVRKDAYTTVLNGTGFKEWSQEYKDFYGPNAEEMYNQIIFPTESLDPTKKEEDIKNYITTGSLPSEVGKKRKNRGGTRRKQTKRKNKTQRKRRRRTIRRS